MEHRGAWNGGAAAAVGTVAEVVRVAVWVEVRAGLDEVTGREGMVTVSGCGMHEVDPRHEQVSGLGRRYRRRVGKEDTHPYLDEPKPTCGRAHGDEQLASAAVQDVTRLADDTERE